MLARMGGVKYATHLAGVRPSKLREEVPKFDLTDPAMETRGASHPIHLHCK